MAEWLKAADCKSVRASVRWFESSPVHQPVFGFSEDDPKAVAKPAVLPFFRLAGDTQNRLNRRSCGSFRAISLEAFWRVANSGAGRALCASIGSSQLVEEQKPFLFSPTQRNRAQPEQSPCIQVRRLFAGKDSLSDFRGEEAEAYDS